MVQVDVDIKAAGLNNLKQVLWIVLYVWIAKVNACFIYLTSMYNNYFLRSSFTYLFKKKKKKKNRMIISVLTTQ